MIASLGTFVAVVQIWVWASEMQPDLTGAMILGVVGSAAMGGVSGLPKTSLTMSLSFPQRLLFSVEVGALEEAGGGLIVGVSNRIDSLFPDMLHKSTVLAQVMSPTLSLETLRARIWAAADCEVGESLPIGSAFEVDVGSPNPVVLIVFVDTDAGPGDVAPSDVVRSLEEAWRVVRQLRWKSVNLPLIGSGLGGVRLSRQGLFSLIAASYRSAVEQERMPERVTVWMRSGDLLTGEIASARQSLKDLGFT